MLCFINPILSAIGASIDTWDFTYTYLSIVVFGGPFVFISNCYSNVIRAEGKSMQAMMGQLIGNLLNVILDPIIILGFGWNIAGAAIATVIGNVVGAMYYVLYFLKGTSSLSINIRDFTFREGVAKNVLAIGIPSAFDTVLMSVSQIIINSQMAEYGDLMIAAMGAATPALIINLCRQGIIFIPSLSILKAAMGMTGLVWAQPVADIISLFIAIELYFITIKKVIGKSEVRRSLYSCFSQNLSG